jgi:alpha-D-xyloside xylohydrolase
MISILIAGLLFQACAAAAPVAVTGVTRQADGVTLSMQAGVMRVQVWGDRVIRVTYAPGAALPDLHSLSVIGKPQVVQWDEKENVDRITIETKQLRVQVDRKTGAVGFFDLNGKMICRETDDGKDFEPTTIKGVEGDSVQDAFVLDADEHIYGLGQHQQGFWNYRGQTVHLQQKNTEVAIPVMVSSKGYGILWDNPAVADVSVGVKGKEDRVEWKSEYGKAIDYYFMDGPGADGVIREYRGITGAAPMMAKWLWGFWQSKERYKSQEELTGIVAEYRKREVPIDGIIQDWQYWKPGEWGSHEFDPERYPDPAGMVKTLHGMNVHVLISVWSRFDVGTKNLEALVKAGAMFEPILQNVYPKGQGRWYDAFSPAGRSLFWQQISTHLMKLGFDGWWLDATEPELGGKWGELRTLMTGMGIGAGVFNGYPLMTTTGVYLGQRGESEGHRVCILTRSAYAGQQRNAAVTWSGDTHGKWDVFANQIRGGLNFSISGIPYWNTDIGAFFGGKVSDKKYQELFTRWFQYGAFCPMMRVHGTGDGKEFWQWDEPTQKIWKTYVGLRYRLMPYIYSVSWQVTNDGGTMMRPLVMDFEEDAKALDVGDQFLFGPAVMVNPVTTAGATSRQVYLPGKQSWFDFWTGKREEGGREIEAAAPSETMPLFVRAGSIIPMGPEIQYVNEKPADPIEVRVYRGADGAFTLYEDEGDNYNYEKGVYATIPLKWDEKAKTLTIGKRTGEFPGMLKERTFRVVFVSADHGVGEGETEKVDQVVSYHGDEISVKAKE